MISYVRRNIEGDRWHNKQVQYENTNDKNYARYGPSS